MRYLSAILFALVLACPSWAQWPYTCVARVHNGNTGGSATVVALTKDGTRARLLSCEHLFEDGVYSPYVTFGTQPTKYSCRVLGTNAELDLSALEIKAPPGMKTAKCVREATDSDTSVVAVGYPYYSRNGKAYYSKGKILGYDMGCYTFSAPVHSGYSGGALFAPDGSLIGVVCGYYGPRRSYAPAGKPFLDWASQYVEVER